MGFYKPGLYQLGDLDLWVRLCQVGEIHIMQEKLAKFRIRDYNLNASAPTIDTITRVRFEETEILRNYLRISKIDELLSIFPEAGSLYPFSMTDKDTRFLLFMMMDRGSSPAHRLLALEMAFAMLNDAILTRYTFKINTDLG